MLKLYTEVSYFMDISYMNNNYTFNYRACAIITNNNRLLLEQSNNNNYYSLVGGRVKFGETSLDAVIREVKEEIGYKADISNCKLINISENFFDTKKCKFHEILMIYKINISSDEDLASKNNFSCLDKDSTKIFWVNKEDLNNMDIRPSSIIKLIDSSILTHSIL